MSRTVTTVALAPHIESFPAAGHKRPYDSIAGAPVVDGNYSAANQLAVPNGQLPGVSGPIPATTARPDRGVNTCIPVARTCASHLTVGQVAFVYRSFNVPVKGSSLGGLEHIISMEQLNERLALPENKLRLPNDDASKLFRLEQAKHVYRIKDANSAENLKQLVFEKDVVKDTFHPYHQYALDGIVCTPADGDEYENDGFKPHSTHQSKPVCNVAVHGPCPLTVLHMPSIHEDFESVRVGVPSKARPAPNVFVQPARVLSEVYVALVASREAKNSKEWTLQYQVVSSSNLDLYPDTSSGVRLFRSKELYEGVTASVNFTEALRLVVEVHRLGKVVDCRFGPVNAPQVVVAVNVKKYERTAYLPMTANVNFPNGIPATSAPYFTPSKDLMQSSVVLSSSSTGHSGELSSGMVTGATATAVVLTMPSFVAPLAVWRSFVRLKQARELQAKRQRTIQQLGGALVKQRAPFGRLRNLTSTMAFGAPVQKADLDALKALLMDKLKEITAKLDSAKQASEDANVAATDGSNQARGAREAAEDALRASEEAREAAMDGADQAVYANTAASEARDAAADGVEVIRSLEGKIDDVASERDESGVIDLLKKARDKISTADTEMFDESEFNDDNGVLMLLDAIIDAAESDTDGVRQDMVAQSDDAVEASNVIEELMKRLAAAKQRQDAERQGRVNAESQMREATLRARSAIRQIPKESMRNAELKKLEDRKRADANKKADSSNASVDVDRPPRSDATKEDPRSARAADANTGLFLP